MPRDGAKVRALLQTAALELYGERGYEATTTADIAARAGVTERTFFRHFADKREVLFDGETEMVATLIGALSRTAEQDPPLLRLRQALDAALPLIEAAREFSRPRMAVIESSAQLRERAAAKHATLVRGLSTALRDGGTEQYTANLAAQIAMAALERATIAWFAEPGSRLAQHLDAAFDDVRAMSDSVVGQD